MLALKDKSIGELHGAHAQSGVSHPVMDALQEAPDSLTTGNVPEHASQPPGADPATDQPTQPTQDQSMLQTTETTTTIDGDEDLPQQPDDQVITRRGQFRAKKAFRENKKNKKIEKAAAKTAKTEAKKKRQAEKQKKQEMAEEKKRQKKILKEQKQQAKDQGGRRKRTSTEEGKSDKACKPAKKKTSLKEIPTKKTKKTKKNAAKQCTHNVAEASAVEPTADEHHTESVVAGSQVDAGVEPIPFVHESGKPVLCGDESTETKPCIDEGHMSCAKDDDDGMESWKSCGCVGECKGHTYTLPCKTPKQRLKPTKASKIRKMHKAMGPNASNKAKRRMKLRQQHHNQPTGASAQKNVKNKKGITSTAGKRDAQGKQITGKGQRTKQEVPPVDEYVKLVFDILKECNSSHCTHPSWEPVNTGPVRLSVYWSRNAVGVKVPKQTSKKDQPQKRSKKEKLSQVAYFACATSCVYSNMVLAGIYVMSSVVVITMKQNA